MAPGILSLNTASSRPLYTAVNPVSTKVDSILRGTQSASPASEYDTSLALPAPAIAEVR